MRQRLRLLALSALFWLLFLATSRILFMLYNHDYAARLTFAEIVQSSLHGLKMDLSLTGYVLMFTGLLLTVSLFTTNNRWVFYALVPFNLIALLFSCIIIVVDLELYRHWGFRMNTTPLMYMGPEAMGSVQGKVMLKLIVILMLLFPASVYLYLKITKASPELLPRRNWKTFTGMVCVSAMMFLPIRGSFTVAPMNTGFVYFHKSKMFANHAAVNVVWNFIYSLRKSAHVVYPENFADSASSENHFRELYATSDSTLRLFNTTHPNIILLIVESFTADVIAPLGGLPDVSPNMNKLCHEGILFDNFYSSGDRTDKGLIAILSGYPAQPQTSIIKYPQKTQELPFLPKAIQRSGYTTSFVYGGDIDFANFRSYLTSCGFDNITFLDDFPDELDESKWGVHDQYVLEHALTEADTSSAPFMQVVLTQSSHEPFTVPMDQVFQGTDEESLFLNSCHYTDKCIGHFIDQAKQKPWWKNTVLIITADHGHRHPGDKKIETKERFHIPLLMLGGALNVADTVIHTIAGQTDIANTLLAQLDKPRPEFKFSKNILSPDVKDFAAWFYNDGYGFITDDAFIIFDNPGHQFIRTDGATEKDLQLSKAYQQVLYSDYNRR